LTQGCALDLEFSIQKSEQHASGGNCAAGGLGVPVAQSSVQLEKNAPSRKAEAKRTGRFRGAKGLA